MGRGIVSAANELGHDAADFLAIGHVTRDVVGSATMVGGAAYYASRTVSALGLRSAMVTSFGPDFEHLPELEPVELRCKAAPVSTRFVNRYEARGREQHLEALAEPLGPDDLPADLGSVGAVYVCPVMGEVDPAVGRACSARLVGAGAQGWMREFDDRGWVRPRRWRPTSAALRSFDLVVLSDEDAAGDGEVVRHLRDRVGLVAFTHGAAGSELFVAGAHHVVPPLATDQVGPTGAGDAFGAALLVGMLWGLTPLDAAYFASCVASVVVEGVGGAALGRVAEAFRRLGPYGRAHGVDVSAIVALAPAG